MKSRRSSSRTSICRRHEARRWRRTPLEQEDLVADGYLALAKAARRYDPSFGVPFPAFATPYVRGAIVDTVRTRAPAEQAPRGGLRGRGRLLGLTGQEAATAPTNPPTPGRDEDTVESMERLRVLATLPERERVALIHTISTRTPRRTSPTTSA